MTQIDSEVLTQIIVLPILFFMTAWIFKLIWDGKRDKLKSALQQKLLEKFDDVKELSNFLQSESGENFLKGQTFEGVTTKEKLLSAVTKGVVLAVVGLAIVPIGYLIDEAPRYIMAGGFVIFFIGVGYLLSTYASYKLSQKFGILDKD